jgi:hypothetical protein
LLQDGVYSVPDFLFDQALVLAGVACAFVHRFPDVNTVVQYPVSLSPCRSTASSRRTPANLRRLTISQS